MVKHTLRILQQMQQCSENVPKYFVNRRYELNTRLKVKLFRTNKNEYYSATVCIFPNLNQKCLTVYAILMPFHCLIQLFVQIFWKVIEAASISPINENITWYGSKTL